jgi:hypothetical protein
MPTRRAIALSRENESSAAARTSSNGGVHFPWT